MESSPLIRRVTFGLIVLVLAGLGAYLIGPVAHGSSSPPPRRSVTTPGASPTPTLAASPQPSGPAPAGAPDIYQWLPFTPGGLAAAASIVQRFGDAYGTFSYTQSATSYVSQLVPLTSLQLADQIKAAYSLPGVAQARSSARQVSTGSAAIQSIRAFGPSSITFLVEVTEQLTATSGRSQQISDYAVTVTGSGSSWQVSDIELASVGNS
jgi:hypothetical protein